MSAVGFVTRVANRVVLVSTACLLVACLGPGGDAGGEGSGAAQPAIGAAASTAVVEPPGEGSTGSDSAGEGDGSAAPEPARLATLWVGIYCSAPDPEPRHFSVYVDGTLAQELDARCPAHVQPGVAAPNGGQFRVVVPTGVRVLRFQDDTSDYHSEHDVPVTGDHWVFVHHRTLPDGTGHLTSIIDRYDRPRFAY